MAINSANADQFFRVGNHRYAMRWQSYSPEDKDSAIAEARRMITRDLGMTLDDSEPAYVEGDVIRHEYGVYEQALHILMNDVFPNAEGTGPVYTGEDMQGNVSVRSPGRWSTEARRWLQLPQQLTLSKG